MANNADPRVERFLAYDFVVSKLVAWYARKVPTPVEDLRGSAQLALWWCVVNYGSLAPAEFERYAWVRVRGSILDTIRKGSWYDKGRKTTPVFLQGDRIIPEPVANELSPEDVLLEARDPGDLMAPGETLEPRDRQIFNMCFECHLPLTEVAKQFGVTSGRACQLRQRMVARLRQALTA